MRELLTEGRQRIHDTYNLHILGLHLLVWWRSWGPGVLTFAFTLAARLALWLLLLHHHLA